MEDSDAGYNIAYKLLDAIDEGLKMQMSRMENLVNV